MVPSCILASSSHACILFEAVTITGRGQEENVLNFTLTDVALRLTSEDAGLVGFVVANGLQNGLNDAFLPGTAFRTGLHPLICRGRRHFCARGRKMFKNLTG